MVAVTGVSFSVMRAMHDLRLADQVARDNRGLAVVDRGSKKHAVDKGEEAYALAFLDQKRDKARKARFQKYLKQLDFSDDHIQLVLAEYIAMAEAFREVLREKKNLFHKQHLLRCEESRKRHRRFLPMDSHSEDGRVYPDFEGSEDVLDMLDQVQL